MKQIISTVLFTLAVISAAPESAQALEWQASNGTGMAMQPLYPADAYCFQNITYAAVTNTCPTPRYLVSAEIYNETLYVPTKVNLKGTQASWCRTMTSNGVGNAAELGTPVSATGTSLTWQLLDTGSRHMTSQTALVFLCYLEPNGIIGQYYAGPVPI